MHRENNLLNLDRENLWGSNYLDKKSEDGKQFDVVLTVHRR
jgi:hypothetical protein